MKKLLLTIIAVSTVSTSAMAFWGGDDHKKKDDRHGKSMEMKKGHDILDRKFMKSLSEETKAKIKAIMGNDTTRDAMKKLMEERNAIVGADKFDTNAFIKNTEKMKELRETAKENRVEKTAEVLSVLTKEERLKLVAKWQERAAKMEEKRAKKADK